MPIKTCYVIIIIIFSSPSQLLREDLVEWLALIYFRSLWEAQHQISILIKNIFSFPRRQFCLWIFRLSISGSQHSGAYEEDFNASSNDLDSNQQESAHENNNESVEDEDDVDGIDARCVVCERQCSDIDQWVMFNRFRRLLCINCARKSQVSHESVREDFHSDCAEFCKSIHWVVSNQFTRSLSVDLSPHYVHSL